jgi:type I restriction enzyme M protein
MPGGTFLGAGVKTVVLFFTKGEPTKNIWYYQFDAGRTMGKTSALNDADLKEFVELQKTKTETEKSWMLDISSIGESFDLSVKNPNKKVEAPLRSPQEIFEEMKALDQDSVEILNTIFEWL